MLCERRFSGPVGAVLLLVLAFVVGCQNDEEKLQALPGKVLEDLSRDGYLMPLFMVLASMANIQRLVERKNRTLSLSIKALEDEELAEALEEYHQQSSSASGTTSLGELLKEQLDQGN